MKNSIKLFFLVVFACALWTPPVLSAPIPSVYNSLENVDVKKLPGDLVIRLKFKTRDIQYLPPKFFNKTVEIDFPGSRLKSESKYFPTQDSEIYQVYISQLDSGLVRLRLMLAQKMAGLEDQLRVENDGRYLEIHISKNPGDTLESLLERATRLQMNKEPYMKKPYEEISEPLDDSASPIEPEVISRVNLLSDAKPLKRDSVPLAQIVGNALPAQRNQISGEEPRIKNELNLFQKGKVRKAESPDMLSTSLKMFYTLIFVLGAMFFLFYLFKKFVWKNGGLGGSGKAVRVLSTGFLGPKKSLALVEIPGEILVLGIADGHISLLSNIRDEEKIAMIKGAGGKKARESNGNGEGLAKEPRIKSTEGGVDVYSRRLVKGRGSSRFSEHLKRSSSRQAAKGHNLKAVTSMIRESLEKMQTV